MIHQNNLVYNKSYTLREHQKITISTIIKKVRNKKNLKFLDVGCANGNLILNLKKKLKNNYNCYEAVEIDKEIIKEKSGIFDKIYFKEYSKFLKKNKQKYDILILSGVVCFFQSPIKIIEDSIKLIKKGGSLIIFDRFTNFADVEIVHSFKNNKKKFSTYNATSLFKLKALKKKEDIKNVIVKKFYLKKKILKNNKNLWQSYTHGKNKNKIILNHLDIFLNFYHVTIKKLLS